VVNSSSLLRPRVFPNRAATRQTLARSHSLRHADLNPVPLVQSTRLPLWTSVAGGRGPKYRTGTATSAGLPYGPRAIRFAPFLLSWLAEVTPGWSRPGPPAACDAHRLTHTIKVTAVARRRRSGYLHRGFDLAEPARRTGSCRRPGSRGRLHDLGHPPFGHLGAAQANRPPARDRPDWSTASRATPRRSWNPGLNSRCRVCAMRFTSPPPSWLRCRSLSLGSPATLIHTQRWLESPRGAAFGPRCTGAAVFGLPILTRFHLPVRSVGIPGSSARAADPEMSGDGPGDDIAYSPARRGGTSIVPACSSSRRSRGVPISGRRPPTGSLIWRRPGWQNSTELPGWARTVTTQRLLNKDNCGCSI